MCKSGRKNDRNSDRKSGRKSDRKSDRKSHRSSAQSDGTEWAIYIDRELSSYEPRPLPRPSNANKYHVCCSTTNPGALALMEELAKNRKWTLCKDGGQRRRRASSAAGRAIHRYRSGLGAMLGARDERDGKSNQLLVTTSVADLGDCDHLLLYLTAETWTRGDEATAILAAEISRAMDMGVHVLLAHEMPGVGQEARHACEFATFFSCVDGDTPQILQRRGIYHSIAVPLKGREWRKASMLLLAEALEKDVGGSKKRTPAVIEELTQGTSDRGLLRLLGTGRGHLSELLPGGCAPSDRVVEDGVSALSADSENAGAMSHESSHEVIINVARV